jgi:peptide subunit release factor 1 (eRF1)
MLTESDLRELLNYSSPEPILSIYLNTDPSEGSADAYRLRLRNMLKEVNLPKDAQEVERYFQHTYDWSGKSVAVFSCAPEKYFKVFPLAVPIRSRVRVSDHPHIKPLADLWDAFGGYGVVLVDKQGARLFSYHLGELEEQVGVEGEAVKHTKSGGASTIHGQRGGTAGQTGYAEEVVDRNMKDTVALTTRFFEEKHIRRILVGGTDDNVTMFLNNLPKAWQSLVVGTFAMSKTASHQDVLVKAMQIGAEAEKKRELRLIGTAITAAAKQTGGVVGLEATMEAVRTHRVQTLLVMEGFFKTGFRCNHCGALTEKEAEKCVFCDGKMEPVLDIIDHAVRSVLQDKGDVEMIHEGPELEKAGKIGALLRY